MSYMYRVILDYLKGTNTNFSAPELQTLNIARFYNHPTNVLPKFALKHSRSLV